MADHKMNEESARFFCLALSSRFTGEKSLSERSVEPSIQNRQHESESWVDQQDFASHSGEHEVP
jgi:hypothetical protein